MLLESVGYKVLLAESGPIGLKILQREKIDTLILEFRMPEMTGAEVAQHIRQANPGIPIIMLSAFVDLTPDQLKDVDAYVTKGDAPEVLLRTIENLQPLRASSGR